MAHSRACCWQYRNTPTFEPSRCLPIRITEYLNGPRWTWAFVAVVRKSDRLTFARGSTTPSPAFPRYVTATSFAFASGLALIAATTCAAVLVSAPVPSVASRTSRSLPVTCTDSGASSWPGWMNSAVMSLPPSWPHARDVSTTARDCSSRPGPGGLVLGIALPGSRVPLIVACALRW